MQIIWSKYGGETLLDHIAFLHSKSPSGANSVKWAILNTIDKLEKTPRIGRPGRWDGTRELSITDYSYVIVYRIKGDFVEILYVHHVRQQWPDTIKT